MNKKIVAVSGVGVIGGVLVFGAFSSGYMVESSFKGLPEQINNETYNFRPMTFERGWFSSQATSELDLTVDGEVITLPLSHTIAHGPGPATLCAAEIDTEVHLTGKLAEAVNEVIGNHSPMTVRTCKGMSGWDITVGSPAFSLKEQGTHIAWGGINGKFTVDGNDVEGTLRLPELKVTEENNVVHLKGMELGLDVEKAGEGLWLGRNEAVLKTVSFQFDEWGMPEPVNISASNASITGEFTFGEEETLVLALEIGLEEGGWAKKASYRNAVIGLKLNQIDREAYLQLINTLKSVSLYSNRRAGRELEQMATTVFPELLGRSPALELAAFGFESDQGRMEATGSLRFDGSSPVVFDETLGQRIEGDFEVTAPSAMVEHLMGKMMEFKFKTVAKMRGIDSNSERVGEAIANARTKALEDLQRDNVLTRTGDEYRLKAEVKANRVLLNGKDQGSFLPL